jgi:hypothetical protein
MWSDWIFVWSNRNHPQPIDYEEFEPTVDHQKSVFHMEWQSASSPTAAAPVSFHR